MDIRDTEVGQLYDFHDVDCEDCGRKFFVLDGYNYEKENAYKCPSCLREWKELQEWEH